MGPPGSGKGTQAFLIEKNFKFFRLAPGDILRDKSLMADKLDSDLIKVINSGALINDDIIFKIVKNNLNYEDILFDGYPRTLNQAKFLFKNDISIDCVINMVLPNESLFRRIKYRIINKKYNFIYSILNKNLSKIRYKDDISGLYFFKRFDDKYSTIFRRLFEYEKNLSFIIDYYIKNNVNIININADDDINNVYNSIKKYIENFYGKKY
jgi:adenylate kinase